NSNIAPPMARAKLPKLHPVTPLLPHRARPIKPPTRAPAIPSSIVVNQPPGSRPGMRSFAIAPAMRPKMAQPIMAPMILLLIVSNGPNHRKSREYASLGWRLPAMLGLRTQLRQSKNYSIRRPRKIPEPKMPQALFPDLYRSALSLAGVATFARGRKYSAHKI